MIYLLIDFQAYYSSLLLKKNAAFVWQTSFYRIDSLKVEYWRRSMNYFVLYRYWTKLYSKKSLPISTITCFCNWFYLLNIFNYDGKIWHLFVVIISNSRDIKHLLCFCLILLFLCFDDYIFLSILIDSLIDLYKFYLLTNCRSFFHLIYWTSGFFSLAQTILTIDLKLFYIAFW